MIHEEHIRPRPVICERQLSNQLWRQFIEVERPWREQEPAHAPKRRPPHAGDLTRKKGMYEPFRQAAMPESVLRHAIVSNMNASTLAVNHRAVGEQRGAIADAMK